MSNDDRAANARNYPSPGGKDTRCTCGGPCHGLKEWSSSEELAAWLGITVRALYWMRESSKGPHGHRIGAGIRYRRGDVEKWLRTRAEDE